MTGSDDFYTERGPNHADLPFFEWEGKSLSQANEGGGGAQGLENRPFLVANTEGNGHAHQQ